MRIVNTKQAKIIKYRAKSVLRNYGLRLEFDFGASDYKYNESEIFYIDMVMTQCLGELNQYGFYIFSLWDDYDTAMDCIMGNIADNLFKVAKEELYSNLSDSAVNGFCFGVNIDL